MMRTFEAKAAFEKVFKELAVIKALVSDMPQVQVQVSSRLLPTINALNAIGGSGTASTICKMTGRSRASESRNLNDLHGRGILAKRTVGRLRVFTIREEII